MKKLLVVLSIIGAIAIWPSLSTAFEEVGDRPSRHPDVEVWLNKHNGAVYQPGHHVRVYFRTSEDCYVVLYNVDTEGFVHVLYPKYNDEAWVEGGYIYEIPDPYDDYELVVDSPTGVEYVVAVASLFPLNVRALHTLDEEESDIYWPMGRITGDPSQAIWEINEKLAWGDETYEPEGYASDISWFYVRRWVPYPRYIVYHWYPDYYYDPWWDPYAHVHIFLDFYWDHYWCRPWWWCYGCRPTYVYWYIDRDTGRRHTWTGHYHHDRRKPDWYREKPVRRAGDVRPSRPQVEKEKIAWEDRRRPTRGEPGQPVESFQDRTKANLDQADGQLRLRETSSRRDREEPTTRKIRTVIRSTESQRSSARTPVRRESSSKSEVKRVQRSSSQRSGIGKIIGSVAKIFSGSKKEKASSQRKAEKSSSKRESSGQKSSQKSSNQERKSR